MAYVVSLSQFDGPLDLLLSMITEKKIDVKEIFVSGITEQYLEAMQDVDNLDMDQASEFLDMAATILEIKSRALVPNIKKADEESEEESPEEMLIRRLLEYKTFKEISGEMRTLEEAAKNCYTKLPEEFPLPPQEFELTGLTVKRLYTAFMNALQRAQQRDAATRPSQREIRKDMYTVRGCMLKITRMARKGKVRFTDLFDNVGDREEIVTLFLALLEMLKNNAIHVAQNGTCEEIWIEAAA